MLGLAFSAVISSFACSTSLEQVRPFLGPDWSSFKALSPAEHAEFRRRSADLAREDFMDIRDPVTGVIRYRGASFFQTVQRSELIALAEQIVTRADAYSAIVFVGRSGLGIKAYLDGRFQGRGPQLIEVPFSCKDPDEITPERAAGLRGFLDGLDLSPQAIKERDKPILFFDFIYSATGVRNLAEQLHAYAAATGIPSKKLRKKMHFLGAYPAEMLVKNNLQTINHASLLEGSPIDMSRETVRELARNRPMPGNLDRFFGRVDGVRISDTFYDYWGNLVSHPNRSFTPDQWTLGARAVKRRARFQDQAVRDRPAYDYLELHQMIEAGVEATGAHRH